jgi:hypothetical protein
MLQQPHRKLGRVWAVGVTGCCSSSQTDAAAATQVAGGQGGVRGYRLLLQQPNQQDATAAAQAAGGRGLGRGQKILLMQPAAAAAYRMPQQPHMKLGVRGGVMVSGCWCNT